MLFSYFEIIIAWRYLRAKRSEGGISTMTWISLIGIALAVFALIVTLAVRSGFRNEFVGTILGANAHVSAYTINQIDEYGVPQSGFDNYTKISSDIAKLPPVSRAVPVVKGKVLATGNGNNTYVEVFGQTANDFATLPFLDDSNVNIERYNQGIAIGIGIARRLGLSFGDIMTLTSPQGVKTPFGLTPRINDYMITNIFSAGRYDVDNTRIYMPLIEAQSYFNKEGKADEIEIMLKSPEGVESIVDQFYDVLPPGTLLWTWKSSNSAFLDALRMEDNIMFIILAILVLIATMNIVSGLIMLVKNKRRDIGILRTFGLTQGSIMRIFFLCGIFTGIVGTFAGAITGVVFVIYLDPIFDMINGLSGGNAWDPSIRMLPNLPAELHAKDILKAMSLSLGLAFVITIFPARKAAQMNPVEALRYV